MQLRRCGVERGRTKNCLDPLTLFYISFYVTLSVILSVCDSFLLCLCTVQYSIYRCRHGLKYVPLLYAPLVHSPGGGVVKYDRVTPHSGILRCQHFSFISGQLARCEAVFSFDVCVS